MYAFVRKMSYGLDLDARRYFITPSKLVFAIGINKTNSRGMKDY